MMQTKNSFFLLLLSLFLFSYCIFPLDVVAQTIPLNVPIPSADGGVLAVSGITQYVSVIFEFAVVFLAVLLTTTMVIAGFLYLASAGVPGKVAFAKELIKKTALSLIFLLFSVVFINLINPNLSTLTLSDELITVIKPRLCCKSPQNAYLWAEGECPNGYQQESEELQCVLNSIGAVENEEEINLPPADTTGFVTLKNQHTRIHLASDVSDPRVSPTMLSQLRIAATKLPVGTDMLVTGAFRTKETQEALIKKNCPKGATRSSQCNPATALTTSAHMTGRAIDVWGYKDGKQCLYPQETHCPSNDPVKQKNCRLDPCQRAVIEAMFDSGFCLLSNEAWHFELLVNGKGVSSNCKLKADFPELNEPFSNPTP